MGLDFETPRDNYAVQGDLSVPLSDYALKVMPARRAASAQRESADLQVKAETLQVQVNARLAFYDWLRARAQTVVARRSLASVRGRLEDARLGLAAGTLTDADVLRLEGVVRARPVLRRRRRGVRRKR